MSDFERARQLHKLLDEVEEGRVLDHSDMQQLRAALPELPKQKTLEELRKEVYAAWLKASGNTWDYDGHELETWLSELYLQLKGLTDAEPATVPALPAGMRLADHKDYGRCVVSPGKNIHGCYSAFHRDNWNLSEAAYHHVSPDTLTFIDTEPAKPAHPEFLETAADYDNAPEGTIVTKDDCFPWTKEDIDYWTRNVSSHSDHGMARSGRRYILRWGWGE